MRCSNCGWENPDGNTKCEKCGTPLSEAVRNVVSNKTARENVSNQNQQAAPLHKTVCESSAFPDVTPNGARVCPHCGYPLRPGVAVCPNCHDGITEIEPQPQVFNPQNAATPIQVNGKAKGTVNPWIQVAPANKCSLEPIAQEGIENPEPLHLKGDKHSLNRENLDPDNQTITSKVQAEITCEDGQWYISDKSAQHTTFVYVGGKAAINDGDIILMGNRQFKFKIEK